MRKARQRLWERGHLARETNALDCARDFRGQDARAPRKSLAFSNSKNGFRVQMTLDGEARCASSGDLEIAPPSCANVPYHPRPPARIWREMSARASSPAKNGPR